MGCNTGVLINRVGAEVLFSNVVIQKSATTWIFNSRSQILCLVAKAFKLGINFQESLYMRNTKCHGC